MYFIVLCLGKANYFKRQTLLMANRHAKENKTEKKKYRTLDQMNVNSIFFKCTHTRKQHNDYFHLNKTINNRNLP